MPYPHKRGSRMNEHNTVIKLSCNGNTLFQDGTRTHPRPARLVWLFVLRRY